MQNFLANGRLIGLLIALLVVGGLGALKSLPRMEDPYLVGRTGILLTPFPGASAERVEALVTEKLENKLRELHELENLKSSSRNGLSFITLDLEDHLTKAQVANIWSRARDLIDEARVNFPAGVGDTQFHNNRSHSFTQLVALNWKGNSAPQVDILGRYANELETRLRRVTGTEFVERFGAPREEVLVSVDSHKLASLGLAAEDVARALKSSDAKVAAGLLENHRSRVSVEVAGELKDLERVRRVPILVQDNGAVVRVGDVASVSRQERTPIRSLAIVGGQRAVVIGARMMPSMRIDLWSLNTQRALERFESTLPANVELQLLFSQQEYTDDRLGGLVTSVIIGFTLILAVLLFTLGWRSALIVALALPLTISFTLIVMQYTGLPIHQMSVTGLIVALGVMVDNAIVMVDTISAEKQKGHSSMKAVMNTIRHLWMPLLGSTLTTMLAFLPVAIQGGSAGEFLGGIALAVIFSLIGSYLISHTIIAALAGRFVRVAPEGDTRWWVSGVQLPQLTRRFEQVLVWSLRNPRRALSAVVVLPLLGFVGVGQLTSQFFPASDRDMFHIEIYMPESSSLVATQAMSERVSDHLNRNQSIERVDWFVGRSAPSFYYNIMQRKDGSANYAQAIVKAVDLEAANRLIPRLQFELDDAFPEAQILVRKLEQGPPFIAPVELRLYGPNVDRLKTLGEDVRRIMSTVPDVVHTRSSLGNAIPKLWVSVAEEEVNHSGLPLRALSGQLQNALDGVVSGSILESTEELPIRIRLAGGAREQLDDLASLDFVPPQTEGRNYGGIPLTAIGDLQYRASRGVITRRNGERVNTIEGYIRDGVLPAAVLADVRAQLEAEGFQLPAGYHLDAGGEEEEREVAVGGLVSKVGFILTLLIVVVVISFNSFRVSSIIFTVAIQAAGLGLLSVYVFDYPFGFMVVVGLLGLIGLAINAAIVILAELKSDANAVRGDEADIVAGVQRCARHITSTTITTVGGFLPLILGGGGFWPPFAIAIAGGTVLTTVLSFIYVPVVFMLFARRRSFEYRSQQHNDMKLA